MFRTLLLFLALALLALVTPLPWGTLWLAVPGAVAAGLLVSWRWGAWGVLVPVLLLIVVMVGVGPFEAWAWWVPVAALTGCWMGLREEGGGPDAGRRAWMLLPLLLLAALLPWTVQYTTLVSGLDRTMQDADGDLVKTSREIGYKGDRLERLERSVRESAALRTRYLPHVLPSALFVWMAFLVVAGRDLSARCAGGLRWPDLSRQRLTDWRLPDAAIWLLMAGLGGLLAGLEGWLPTAWTLLIVPALGYCVQGIAVVESLLLLRGVPPSIIVLTLLFVGIMALPVFVFATVCVGLSDIWLDYRHLEETPEGDPS